MPDKKTEIVRHAVKPGVSPLKTVKNLIAVGSGKGGVGKSTISFNLALALKEQGARVGLIDADIYGPSQPVMLGTQTEKPIIKDRKITPINKAGIQSISMGNLVESTAAMTWRGPMLGKALEQLIHDTVWDNLDYLIVDLPPGTGDVPLTLCQKMPLIGVVLVTTPQELALADVRRAAEMFLKLTIPLLGVIENMSTYQCAHCGHEDDVFGASGGRTIAKEYDCLFLGEVPLVKQIREQTDSGEAKPDLLRFGEIASKLAGHIASLPKDYSVKFPKIVVKD